MNLEELLLVLSASNLRTRFPISEIADCFGADAATVWQSGDLDPTEVILVSTHNRPDLLGSIHKKAFVYSESFISRLIENGLNTQWRVLPTSAVSDTHWENNDLRDFTCKTYKHIGCIVFRGASGRETVVIFYYVNDGEFPSDDVLRPFTRIGATLIDTFWDDYRIVAEDRRKIGHEIGRHLNACNEAMEAIYGNRKLRARKREKILSDFRESIGDARAASENETFIEGVLARRQLATHLDLYDRVQSVARITSRRDSAFGGLINVNNNILLSMNGNDFDLMASNLVSNAEKYSLTGSYVIRTDEIGDGDVKLTFSNPSEYLDPSDREKVWRYKQRGSNSINQVGSGIGLTIVKDICNAYKIGHDLFQRSRGGRLWTHVVLDFPSKMCARKFRS